LQNNLKWTVQMRNDFCAFILTHGRPDRVYTYKTLRNHGYTGRIVIVIDDEDKSASQYYNAFGEQVEMFCKSEIAKTFDEGDNFNDRRAIIYARNATFEIAKKIGVKHFIQLDDDYTTFNHTITPDGMYLTARPKVKNLNAVFEALLDFKIITKTKSISTSQGGDFIGGPSSAVAKKSLPRKCMNSFICSVDDPFMFDGRINEDVNTYTEKARRGMLFFTYPKIRLEQKQTQSNPGGMTELYLDKGTYVKSFYSVMYCPSAVDIFCIKVANARLHHRVNWSACAPQIIREAHRKPRRS